MNIDIREYIKNNFKEDNINDIRTSIDKVVDSHEEEPLIGLGVFFEILWRNVTEVEKEKYVNIIKDNMT